MTQPAAKTRRKQGSFSTDSAARCLVLPPSTLTKALAAGPQVAAVSSHDLPCQSRTQSHVPRCAGSSLFSAGPQLLSAYQKTKPSGPAASRP